MGEIRKLPCCGAEVNLTELYYTVYATVSGSRWEKMYGTFSGTPILYENGDGEWSMDYLEDDEFECYDSEDVDDTNFDGDFSYYCKKCGAELTFEELVGQGEFENEYEDEDEIETADPLAELFSELVSRQREE